MGPSSLLSSKSLFETRKHIVVFERNNGFGKLLLEWAIRAEVQTWNKCATGSMECARQSYILHSPYFDHVTQRWNGFRILGLSAFRRKFSVQLDFGCLRDELQLLS